jgi:DNA-binding helix-hairpin-helix protein with protein kinase domain
MAANDALWDDGQHPLSLGQELGRGGEGAVYALESRRDAVVKIYAHPVSALRQRKLAVLTRTDHAGLRAIAALPQSLVHRGRGGPVVGFVMPAVLGHREIHEIYSPSRRKHDFPDIDWAFLLHVARNLAAAVDCVHAGGMIIGDLNQKGVLVHGRTAMVRLIDCESFQVRDDTGQLLPCEVGVADYTPPELQGHSLRQQVRTINHDHFALAVLCFQLLFMGRHPFAGRYYGRGEDTLERAIAEHRFAYGRSAPMHRVLPPPYTLQLQHLPAELAALFEQAFDATSIRHSLRPTAATWLGVLDRVRTTLVACPACSIHTFPPHLSQCPWCALERQAGVSLFVSPVHAGQAWTGDDRSRAWKAIAAIPAPPVETAPKAWVPLPAPVPTPWPGAALAARAWRWRIMAGLLGLAFAGLRLGWPLLLLAVVLIGATAIYPAADTLERDRRRRAVEGLKAQWRMLQQRWQQEADAALFMQKRAALVAARDAHAGIGEAFQAGLGRLETQRRDLQLALHLERFTLERAPASVVGPGLRASLISSGIQHAGDCGEARLAAVPGCRAAQVRALVAWRRSLEQQFVYDPRSRVDVGELAHLEQTFVHQRLDLEMTLVNGADTLRSLAADILRARAELRLLAQQLSLALARAEADLRP